MTVPQCSVSEKGQRQRQAQSPAMPCHATSLLHTLLSHVRLITKPVTSLLLVLCLLCLCIILSLSAVIVILYTPHIITNLFTYSCHKVSVFTMYSIEKFTEIISLRNTLVYPFKAINWLDFFFQNNFLTLFFISKLKPSFLAVFGLLLEIEWDWSYTTHPISHYSNLHHQWKPYAVFFFHTWKFHVRTTWCDTTDLFVSSCTIFSPIFVIRVCKFKLHDDIRSILLSLWFIMIVWTFISITVSVSSYDNRSHLSTSLLAWCSSMYMYYHLTSTLLQVNTFHFDTQTKYKLGILNHYKAPTFFKFNFKKITAT